MTWVGVDGHEIGRDKPCFVIAEAGVNHNGDVELARKLIDIAAQAGASAVKFQTFAANRLATANAPKAAYQKVGLPTGESQRAMLERLELSPEAHRILMRHCVDRAIMFLSSAFDEEAADLLDSLEVAAFKVPSGELTNLTLLQHIAAKRRPIIMSTGMASLSEVATAVDTLKAAGNSEIVLLHCLSSYPAEPAEVNLRAMQIMEKTCGVPVGFSDHTEGTAIALAAVALGACVIEKHFTIDRKLPGPDQRASLEPGELNSLVRDIRNIEAALGDGQKILQPSETENRNLVRKSLAAAHDLPAGATVRPADLTALRPGTGIAPGMAGQIVGRCLRVPVSMGKLIEWDMLV
jgi:N,N'-diacetyllegionaminate synthase